MQERAKTVWMWAALVQSLELMPMASAAAAPTLTWPPAGATVASNRPDITWVTAPSDAYEVHICLQNDPNATTGGWNSGGVWTSEVSSVMSGPLTPQTWYYAFVRLHDSSGWSPWSTGRLFYVAGQWLNDPYWAGDDGNFQWPHAICYNPDRNESLLAFVDKRTRWNAAYCILNGAGQKISAQQTVLDDDPPLTGVNEATVAYNPAHNEYLIAYVGWIHVGTTDYSQLRGQKVDAQTGQKKGPSYVLFDPVAAMADPRISYSAASDVYLVTWSDTSGDHEIYATRVSGATGQRIGGIINLTTTEDNYSAFPDSAWNSARNEFLVIYQVSHEALGQGWDYFARRIRASDGQMMNEPVQLTNRPPWEWNGDVAYDADLDRYLVVYEGADAGSAMWGQFVTSDGALDGPRFPVLDPIYRGGSIRLAWHPNTREFLAGWLDCCSYSDYARRISQVGVPLGERFRINGDVLGIGNWDPIPLPNTSTNDWLFSWTNSYNDIWTRRYKALPMPDVTPPAPVTQLIVMPAHGQITLNWTTSSSADALGAIVRYKTDGYPAGPHDGLPLAIQTRWPNLPDSYTHAGLQRANTYYYAVFAYDAIPNHGPAAMTSARPLAQADFNGDIDVDQDDFGHFQACLSGSGQVPPPGCDNADLNGDGQVDQDDLAVFRTCMNGPNNPPGC